ncbi:MAG: hypothetical protein AB7O62_05885 [Pirellulales bacterium]
MIDDQIAVYMWFKLRLTHFAKPGKNWRAVHDRPWLLHFHPFFRQHL